jgi:hypothetical protein
VVYKQNPMTQDAEVTTVRTHRETRRRRVGQMV